MVNAQVTPDGTLSTSVTQSGNTFTIDLGNRSGNNLFHSFGQFSVPTGGAVIFNNAPDIQNIFSRITGGVVSNIDGVIQANGTANLFLLNPSGILFGPNAALNIGGSFIGTTADSIKFADGVEFSVVNPTASPLLTISVPIGLQMGQNPGTIVNQSQDLGGLFGGLAGLKVQSGQTIALIGGDISITDSGIYAPDGRIELGSVAGNSLVQITSANPGWRFGYTNVQTFQDIRLSIASMLVTDGNDGGSIHLQGRQISLQDGSFIYNNTLGAKSAGDITVRASESLDIGGPDAYRYYLPSSIFSGARAGSTGRGGDILIEAPILRLHDGGQIGTTVESSGNAGNLTVHSQDIQLIGASDYFIYVSGLYLNVQRGASGKGGELTILTDRLSLADGAEISTATRGGGDAANITIQAKDITVVGSLGNSTFPDLLPTLITSQVDATATGNGGVIAINTDRLSIREGARISAETFGQGNAGRLLINATQSINVTGVSAYSQLASALTTAVQDSASGQGGNLTLNTGVLSITKGGSVSSQSSSSGNSGLIQLNTIHLFLDQNAVLSTASTNTGKAGDISIQAEQAQLLNGSQITTRSTGTGEGGMIQLEGRSLTLQNNALISAATTSSNGGNLTINLSDLLFLRDLSQLTAEAGGTGNGGNITIQAPIILGIKNSDVLANAFRGNGGTIQIATQGILGLKYRDQLTPDNDITASSEFGVNGTVDITNPGVDPNSGLVNLPANLTDPTQQIAQGCALNQGSTFTITGRGGIPDNPISQFNNHRSWADLRNLTPDRHPLAQMPSTLRPNQPLMEAIGWRRNRDGQVELFAAAQPVTVPTALAATCIGER